MQKITLVGLPKEANEYLVSAKSNPLIEITIGNTSHILHIFEREINNTMMFYVEAVQYTLQNIDNVDIFTCLINLCNGERISEWDSSLIKEYYEK